MPLELDARLGRNRDGASLHVVAVEDAKTDFSEAEAWNMNELALFIRQQHAREYRDCVGAYIVTYAHGLQVLRTLRV